MKRVFRKVFGLISISMSFLTTICSAHDACSCCPSSCGDFFVYGEALIFKACEDGLILGTDTNNSIDGPPDNHFEQKIVELNPKWNTGYRVGLGWEKEDLCIGLDANWTHYDSCASKGISFDPVELFIDRNFIPAYGDFFANRANAHWRFRIDTVEINLGHSFCLTQCIRLRPYIGIKAACIRQKYNLFFTAEDLPTTFGPLTLLSESDLHQKFEGAGLNGGFDANWEFCSGFSLYSKVGGSLLWGNYKNRSHNFLSVPIIFGIIDGEENESHNDCQAIADFAAGVEWKSSWFCDKLFLTLHFGWEQHIFFEYNRLKPVSTFEIIRPKIAGDLTLNGFVLGAKIDF